LEIPSTKKKIKYRPFLVKEEKVLLLALESENEKNIKDAVVGLLKACIQSRVKVENLATFDLEYIFLNIRAVSVGEIVEMNVTCQDDDETQVRYNLNLTDVDVIFPEGHSNKIMLTDTTGVVMKYPSIDGFVQGQFSGTNKDFDVIDAVAASIDQIFQGEDVYDESTTTKKEFVQFVESLTNEQLEKIQAFFETSPRLEYSFKVPNPNTGVESEYTLRGLQSFFG
jgi:methyltransferase-like protein